MKIQTEEFQKALRVVKPAVAKTDLIDQSTCFIFDNGHIVGYNGEMCIMYPVIGLEATGAVLADPLYNYILKLKRDTMELKTTSKEMQIKCGKSHAGLALDPDIRIPIDKIVGAGKWFPLPEFFNDFMLMASGAAARDLTDPKLTCISVDKSGKIVGSDNFRILECTLEPFSFDNFLLPAETARIVANMKPTKISISKGWVHFQNEDTKISCQTYPDEYVDVSEFMQIEGPEFVFPKTFMQVMDRASVFSKAAIAQDEEVTITVGNNRIKITAKNENGWFREELNYETTDSPFSFTIIPYLLKDILRRTNTCTVNENGLAFDGDGWRYVSALINME